MVFRCSSSLANFHDKLKAYLKLDEWHWWKNRNDRVIFFGLYHWKDYIRFIWHRGPKKVFWCGSDVIALNNSWWTVFIASQTEAKFYVENEVEYDELRKWWIGKLEIRPMLFDDPDKYQISYKWQKHTVFFATYHKGREKEYGYRNHPDLDFLEGLSEREFNEKIKNYSGAVRFNEFDGFAETLAKSVLMGQYPYSRIKYPYINQIEEGVSIIDLPKEPNYEASNYWRKTLKENKDAVINNW